MYGAVELLTPAVSVVIPTRDRVAWIREAVGSVERQTMPALELIVVDDNSQDSTWSWLERRENARLRPISLERHSERSATRNRGLLEAQGEFILFLDDDDRLVPRALERLVGALRRSPESVAAVGGRIQFSPATYKRAPHVRRLTTRPIWPEVLAGWLPGWFAISGQVLFRTAQLREAGGWNEKLVVPEDQELQLRLSRFGPATVIPWSVLEYRIHPGQWRPHDLQRIEDAFRREFLTSLDGEDFELALHVTKAGDLLRSATASYNGQEYAEALRCFIAAAREAPVLLRSPLTGPRLRAIIGKAAAAAAIGRGGVGTVRRLKSFVTVREPDPESEPEIRPTSTLREGDDDEGPVSEGVRGHGRLSPRPDRKD